MKIVIVINSLHFGGGAERVASSLGDALIDRGHEVNFILFEKDEKIYSTKGGIFVLPEKKITNSFKAFLLMFKRAFFIARYCRKNKVNTVISFMESANFASVISRLLFGNKARVVVSVRENPDRKKTKAKKMMIFLYRFADKVVINSLAGYLKLENWGLRNIEVIHNQVDYERLSILSKESLSLEDKNIFSTGKTFITVGRFSFEKGQSHLIRAFSKIVQKYSEVKLVVLGDGFLRLKIENLINLLNLSNKVFLLGNKKNIFPFLSQSNFFVLSSISEGSPNTIIEALAVGLPVVSTDCETGPREILAPDLGSLDKIEYPYIGKYGILSAPLEEDEIWDDRPLSFSEEKLFQAMEKIIQLDVKKSEPVVIDKFKSENVIDKWEKNII